MWVTHRRMLCSLPGSCLVLPLHHFDSEAPFAVKMMEWEHHCSLFTTVQLWTGDIFNCVSYLLVKKHAAFKWKDAIYGFPLSPGSAEALVGCGGKIKYFCLMYVITPKWEIKQCNWCARCMGIGGGLRPLRDFQHQNFICTRLHCYLHAYSGSPISVPIEHI